MLLASSSGLVERRKRGSMIYLEENSDAEIHERFREVNNTLASIVDGHRGDS